MLNTKPNINYLNNKKNFKFNFEPLNDISLRKSSNRQYRKPQLKKRIKSSLSTTSKINDNNNPVENQHDNNLYKNILPNRRQVLLKSALSTDTNLTLKKDLKTRVYTSFLEHTYSNPFNSNYDILAKSNPNFYMNLMKENGIDRFNRTKSSINIIDYSLNNSIFKKLIIAQSLFKNKKRKDQNEKDTELEKNSNDKKNLFIDYRANEKKSSQNLDATLSNRNSVIDFEKKKTNVSNQKSDDQTNGINKYEKSNTTIINKQGKNDLNEKEILMFIDERKLVYIKNWLENVERAHEKEGKFLETINKITFYDD